LIGEHEIFEKKPFSCFVQGITDITVLELQRDYFLKWYELDKNISMRVTQSLCNQLYTLSNKAGIDNLYSLTTRICRMIVNRVHNEKSMTVCFDRENLSEQMGVTLRSINRTLKELRECGIIDIYENSILVKKLSELEKEAFTK
jgi:CRP-like cAMP-binding protein